jgi:hypothetical protein
MQTEKLAGLDNAFEASNHVRCFNHTLQFSAKALLKPFHSILGSKNTTDDKSDDDDALGFLSSEDEEDEDEDEHDEAEDGDGGWR